MIPPVQRAALRERERLDGAAERALALEESAAERLELYVELHELALGLHEGAQARFGEREPLDDREDKARVYSKPLAMLARG